MATNGLRPSGPGGAGDVLAMLDICAQAGQMLMIVGDPGVGKTAMVRAWSEKNGYGEPICIIGSRMDPTDVQGLPYPSGDHAYTEYLAPAWQKRALDGRPHVLFFDEFSNTPRSVQASLLNVIEDRRFANGMAIPDDVVLVGAMNPDETAADYNPISMPMVSRLTFVSYKPGVDTVADGIASGWKDAPQAPARYARTDSAERGWRQAVASFLRANSAQMQHAPALVDENQETSMETALGVQDTQDNGERWILMNSYATPRGWEKSARLLAYTGPAGQIDGLRHRILRGTVGAHGAAAFADYMHRQSSVDPYEVIRHPETVDWAHVDMNTATETAERIAGLLESCDGKEGRPDAQDVADLYMKVAGLRGDVDVSAAMPYFANHLTAGGPTKGVLSQWWRRLGVTQSQWIDEYYLPMYKAFHQDGALNMNPVTA